MHRHLHQEGLYLVAVEVVTVGVDEEVQDGVIMLLVRVAIYLRPLRAQHQPLLSLVLTVFPQALALVSRPSLSRLLLSTRRNLSTHPKVQLQRVIIDLAWPSS